MRTEEFQKALEQYNLIIDRQTEWKSHIVSVIGAYEYAGNCLLKLSEDPDLTDNETLKMEAKTQFKKALSLAAELAIKNPQYAHCEVKVWKAFRRLEADVEKIPSHQQRYKEKIALLDLAKNKDIAKVIREMLEQGLELDDIELFQKGLKCYLQEGNFEDAFAFLKIACTNSCLTRNVAWANSEIVFLRATTYIATSWERLTKSSPDSRHVFQQMFQLRYGQCAGMVSGEDDEASEIKKSDVLIVNDESADCEEQLDVTSILARNLARVFTVIFGLDTARNLERNLNFGYQEETQLKEMEKYHLVVLIVGDQDGKSYKTMLEAAHTINGPNILVLFTCRKENCPKILAGYKSLDMADEHWHQTKLLDSKPAQDSSNSGVVDKRTIVETLKTFFDSNLEAVKKLFCLLVDENFEKHRVFFENPVLACTD